MTQSPDSSPVGAGRVHPVAVDLALTGPLAEAGRRTAELADLGADGVFTFEGAHDVFAPLVLAAAAAPVHVYPGVAIALPRSPMHLANIAWDLQELSGGRFLLGLGSQIRAHIVKRFSAEFDPPAPRLRELVLAVKAILHAWQTGGDLDFRGEYYQHTLMTPTFDPGPNPHGVPPVILAAVGPVMTRLAGEVADGAILHPFHTSRFVRERWLPLIHAGAERAGRPAGDHHLLAQIILVTGRDATEMDLAAERARGLLAFYASTPAYRPPLDLEGWGDIQPELNRLSKAQRWADMPAVIDDTVLDAFTVRAEPSAVGGVARERLGPAFDRVALSIPGPIDDEVLGAVIDGFH